MALKSDIKAANDNRPVDLHERRVVDPNMDMSQAVLDLRKPHVSLEKSDHNFFFEFLPTASAHMPTLPTAQTKDAVANFFENVWNFVREYPRYVMVGVLVLLAILLFALSAATHRTITRSNAVTPSAATTSTAPPTGSTAATAAASTTPAASTPSAAPAATARPTANSSSSTAATAPSSNTAPSSTTSANGSSTPSSTSQSNSTDPSVCAATPLAAACINLTLPKL